MCSLPSSRAQGLLMVAQVGMGAAADRLGKRSVLLASLAVMVRRRRSPPPPTTTTTSTHPPTRVQLALAPHET